jgi:tripartite-type tricarboxylate transporter receptor subunit TctC
MSGNAAGKQQHVRAPRLRINGLMSLIAAALCCAGARDAPAQGFPARPVTLVVPFAAGGPTDVLARILASRMAKPLGQMVVVENVTGASGSIGVAKVVRAAPDGYTVSIGPWNTHVVNGAVYPLRYDMLTDLEPLAMIATNPLLIIVRNDLPARTVKELIGWLKANPDKGSNATGGPGSASHVVGIYFQNATGTKFLPIAYRGAGPALQEVAAGRMDLMFDQVSNSLLQIRAGKIRAVTVTAPTRLAALPEVPTVDEAGLPEFYIPVWHGTWVPKGTPKEVIARLNAAVVEALADPVIRARLSELSQDIPPRDQQTPQALGAFHKTEIEKWWPIIKAAGIKLE